MDSASQLYLLADHIKLSLLERQRAISLNLEPTTQDGHISRSLDSMREGLEKLEAEYQRLAEASDPKAPDILDQNTRLRTQYDDLTSQFRGFPTTSSAPSTLISQPNSPSLAPDFSAAKSHPSRPSNPSSSSFLKRTPTTPPTSKSVRFHDTPRSPSPPSFTDDTDAENTANRTALFQERYRDDPDSNLPDQSSLSNQQIHTYHTSVLRDQDEQLDRLGTSIGRQRELSMQIGDELEEQIEMLDDVEGHVDRQEGKIRGAGKRVGRIIERAKGNMSMTVIIILICVLVLLIVILK